MGYDKEQTDELKNSLSIEDVYNYVAELGGEPRMAIGGFVARTVCHNVPGSGSHKMYYYDNTHLFNCYTDCGERFDIFELTLKVKKLAGLDWSLPKAIAYVAAYFGYELNFNFDDEVATTLEDWEFFKHYDKINNMELPQQKVEMKIYNSDILLHLPHPIIEPWEHEGISREVMERNGICYYPVDHSIIIPHYDLNGNLIGIRSRTLVRENEIYGKYKPAILNGKMYNHPLGFNLYNLNNSKDNIALCKRVIIFEGEKSPMLYATYFGADNDISVACCGSSLISYQVKMLLDLGVKEIVIAFDKQFQEIGDDEFKRWTKKLKEINKKYSAYVRISFMFDKWGLLGYKSSPIDEGKEKFLELFERRIIL